MKDLWYQRSVGIKLRGFEQNPHDLAKQYAVLSESNAKGEAHGTKNTFKENQIHFVKLVQKDVYWGDELIVLEGLKSLNLLLNLFHLNSFWWLLINLNLTYQTDSQTTYLKRV